MNYGTIMAYDSGRRAGVLRPDVAGAPIVFAFVDDSQPFPEPTPFERYSYGVLRPREGGQPRAVNLRRQQSHREQAEAQAG